jgi:hypothetical protein
MYHRNHFHVHAITPLIASTSIFLHSFINLLKHGQDAHAHASQDVAFSLANPVTVATAPNSLTSQSLPLLTPRVSLRPVRPISAPPFCQLEQWRGDTVGSAGPRVTPWLTGRPEPARRAGSRGTSIPESVAALSLTLRRAVL